jgi:hypothetical protein
VLQILYQEAFSLPSRAVTTGKIAMKRKNREEEEVYS